MNTNIFKTLACGLSLVSVFACSKLDRDPLDNIAPEKYYNTADQLASFTLDQYKYFPNSIGSYSAGMATWDNGTDNQAGVNPNLRMFTKDEWRVPANGGLGFNAIRDINYFINTVEEKIAAKAIAGTQADINHYLGEAYFFRAYQYYDKLQAYGDFPIITQTLPEDAAVIQEHAKRQARNKVARFILADLDKAHSLLKANYPRNQRVTKKVALLFKSRVALYEATFEKYHRGSGRVPGDANWPGKDKEWNKGFSIDQEAEVNFFLDEAMKSAKEVADAAVLTHNNKVENPVAHQGWNPYFELFGTKDLASFPEALLWREHSRTVNIVHHTSNRMTSGTATGWTRSLVESFLTEDGKPYYKKTNRDDTTVAKVKEGRDSRLKLFMFAEGDVLSMVTTPARTYEVALLLESDGNVRETTGYRQRKGMNYDPTNLIGGGVTDQSALVYFRSAEALLNYIEASYLRKGTLDADATNYWNKLRQRAGITGSIDQTISQTDMNIETDITRPGYDWAAYSAGQALTDATLYSIRRERRCEFAGEGYRMDDLIRWCAMDQVKDYHVEGVNFWDTIHTYDYFKKDDPNNKGQKLNETRLISDGSKDANISSQTLSNYVRPYQKFNSDKNKAYNGYTFYKAHYLSPFSASELLYCSPTNDPANSNLYQNPGWGVQGDSQAEY